MTASPLIDTLGRLERSRDALRVAVDLVPPALRDRALSADRWSVAGVLEHLALVDERNTALLTAGIASAQGTAATPETAGAERLPATIETMLADRSARRSAPEHFHPQGLAWDAAWARAEAARAALRRLLEEVDPELATRVVHTHPRFGALSVSQWGQFLAAHEARHAEQVREIAAQIAGHATA